MAAPTGHERSTKDSERSAPNWATPSSPTEPSVKTTRLASWQRKGTAGSQPRPTSSQTSRRPAWSTATAASGTRWSTIRGKSLLSTWRLSGILPGHGRSQTLFRAVRASDSPQGPRGHQRSSSQRHRHRLRRSCRMGVWGYLPSGHPCLVWKAFLRGRLGPDTAPCLPGRVWPAPVSQSPRGDHLLREADRGLVARKQGPGLLRHRQIHPGQQGRWKKAHKAAGDRPRRARLPCPGHPPLGHFGRSASQVRARSHPHLLQRLSTAVRPSPGLDAGLRPHQPPLYAAPDEVVRVATDSIYVRKTALYKLEGSGPTSLRRCTQKGIAAFDSPATARQPRDRHEMDLFQPSGTTRARASTCRCNTRPTSPDQTTKQQKRTSLPAPRRATTTLYPDTGSPTSPAAGAAAKPRERSRSSVPETPSSSPRPITWPKRWEPGGSRPRPITASSVTLASNMLGRPKKISSFSRASLNTSGRLWRSSARKRIRRPARTSS